MKKTTKTKTKWETITEYDNGWIIKRPTAKKRALDLSLKVAGATVFYGLGMLAGEVMDNIPYINQWIPQAVDYVSGIDVAGNLDGLVGLLGAVYGSRTSGTEILEDKPNQLQKVSLTPLLTLTQEE